MRELDGFEGLGVLRVELGDKLVQSIEYMLIVIGA